MVIPISAFALAGPSVAFSMTKPAAAYEGTLSADGSTIAGNWKQGGAALPLTFMRRAAGAAAPVLNRPQEPHPPYPYRSEDVTYRGPGGITLAGTVTEPNGSGPFAAAILIAGSGPHDRDETIFGHKPFHVLADYLTRHGIAVLRSDKRGIGKSTGNYGAATSEDFADDAEAAIAYLKTRSEIDPKKIGLIGHSEGGLIAPIVAAKDHSVAFIVLMAGPGLTGEQILVLQRRLIAQGMGEMPDQTAKADAFQKALLDAIARGKTAEEARANAKALIAAAHLSAAEEAAIDAQLPTLTSPWLRFFLTYDPAPALGKVTCPILALDGEKDSQVPPKEDLDAIKAAAVRQSRRDDSRVARTQSPVPDCEDGTADGIRSDRRDNGARSPRHDHELGRGAHEMRTK